jgi:hypothetical protein
MNSEAWSELVEGNISVDDIDIHPDHLDKFNQPYDQWIIRVEDCAEYASMYPLEFSGDGIRFKCVYVNINKTSKNFRKLCRLTAWVNGSGQVDFDEEQYEPYIKKWKR